MEQQVTRKQNDLHTEVRLIVAEVAEIDGDQIQDDSHFIEDLNIDSMLSLEILSLLEKKFKVTIDGGRLPNMTTVDRTVEILRESMGNRINP